VNVGQTVEFSIDSTNEIHNVAFGPRAYRKQLARDIATPRPSPTPGPPTLQLSPLVFLPSDPPPVLPPLTGANHGNGFLNTGALDRDPGSPNPPSATVQFSRAGSYEYECLIHPGMIGKVTVR
jgi:plastocyanin